MASRQKKNAASKKPVSKNTLSKTTAKPLPVIDQSIKNDRGVEIRGTLKLSAAAVAKTLRALLIQNLAKGDSRSTLKLYLGAADADGYRLQNQAALCDVLPLINRPVDVIVKAGISADVMKTFLAATGKRYMYAGASIHMGVVTHQAPYGKNKDSQVRRQLFNDYMNDLQTLVMQRAGITDRHQVYQDLISAKGFNALEALAYGKKGLVDGILMGHDQVITRVDLDAFYRQKRMKPAEIELFNQRYINIYQLPTRSLAAFSKASVPDGTLCFYKPIKASDAAAKKDSKKEEKKEESKTLTLYLDEKKVDEIPLNSTVTKDKPSARMAVQHVQASATGILDDDVIFFNDGFRDETAEQISQALVALDHKKIRQMQSDKQASHIKIIENSPGGSVWSGQELRSLIRSLKTPVDVIVYGMGASCGSWLLCSATGNRLATPNARIMFHEAANAISQQVPHNHYNEIIDGLDQATIDYISIVAEATGRSFEDVLVDFNYDVWLNPVEALFYGSKGLLDGILVDAQRVITRAHVEAYLLERFKTKGKLTQYATQKLLEKRDPRLGMNWRPEHHDEADPFDNPLKTIATVAKISAEPFQAYQKRRSSPLKAGTAPCVGISDRSLDYFNVWLDET